MPNHNNKMRTGQPLAKHLVVHPEHLNREWMAKITPLALNFFGKNPDEFTAETFKVIRLTAGHQIIEAYHGGQDGFAELHEVLMQFQEYVRRN